MTTLTSCIKKERKPISETHLCVFPSSYIIYPPVSSIISIPPYPSNALFCLLNMIFIYYKVFLCIKHELSFIKDQFMRLWRRRNNLLRTHFVICEVHIVQLRGILNKYQKKWTKSKRGGISTKIQNLASL